MVSADRLARLQTLRYSLGTATKVIRELHDTRALMKLAEDDPNRFAFLLDVLNASMEPDEMGSVQHTLTAVAEALGD